VKEDLLVRSNGHLPEEVHKGGAPRRSITLPTLRPQVLGVSARLTPRH
jgi:hypothetical protein